MKHRIFIIAFLLISIASLKAQTVTCSDFSITDVNPDTLDPNTYQIGISFNAASNEFVNYPHVNTLLNCNGDTLATGSIFWFGQFGQSTQDYPVTTTGASFCLPLSAVFIYGNSSGVNDTCLLTFNTTEMSEPIGHQEEFFIYPNPALEFINVKAYNNRIGSSYRLYDHTGRIARAGSIDSGLTKIELNDLPAGVYFFHVTDNNGAALKVIKE